MTAAKVLLVNGPNLSILGFREPEKYGTETLAQIESQVSDILAPRALQLCCFQHDVEGHIVEFLNKEFLLAAKGKEKVLGIIINPGAYAHSSVAIRDALSAFKSQNVFSIEVHLTNIFAREEFRKRTITGEACDAMISGFGSLGYYFAAQHLAGLRKSDE